MDILWPRWVARIGVTRSTQAWFLTADRQCTSEMRHAGVREELGEFVRQYERVRAAVREA